MNIGKLFVTAYLIVLTGYLLSCEVEEPEITNNSHTVTQELSDSLKKYLKFEGEKFAFTNATLIDGTGKKTKSAQKLQLNEAGNGGSAAFWTCCGHHA